MNTDELLYRGGYPRIHADRLDPTAALGDYFETYVQRDLRELVQLKNIVAFERFVRLAAGRTGQVLNLQSLAADVGVSGHTAREWITLLEASFIVFRLPPWFANIGKRLIKSPKLYFYDVGLAAWLLGIKQPEHLATHPLRGNLFENLAVLEVLKTYHNTGERPDLHYYRDSAGNEADLVLQYGAEMTLVEIKSAQTITSDAMCAVANIRKALGARVTGSALIYGGAEAQRRRAGMMRYLAGRFGGGWVAVKITELKLCASLLKIANRLRDKAWSLEQGTLEILCDEIAPSGKNYTQT